MFWFHCAGMSEANDKGKLAAARNLQFAIPADPPLSLTVLFAIRDDGATVRHAWKTAARLVVA